MHRAQAILLIVALLAAPLALLARGGACCERTCCSKRCCLPEAYHAAAERAGGKTTCHQRSSLVPDCAMQSVCNHSLDYGFASPLPPTVLQAAGVSLALNVARSSALAGALTFSAGFVPAPFEPPRS